MPVTYRKRGEVYRLVEAATGRIAKTHLGNARDGGGHEDKAAAARQAAYINKALKDRS